MSSRPIYPPGRFPNRAELREKLITFFNLDELQALCFDLGIEYEDFQQTKGKTAQGLIEQCERTGQIDDLLGLCQKRRPDGRWNELYQPKQAQTESSRPSISPSPQILPAEGKEPTTTIDQNVGAIQGGTVIGSLFAGPGSTITIGATSPGQPSTTRSQEPTPDHQERNAKSQELPAELTLDLAGVPITFVRVPAGEFYMGSDTKHDSNCYPDELPEHKLFLDEYWIGKYPVTVAQFRAFVSAQIDGYQTQSEKNGESYTWIGGSDWGTVKGANWLHPQGPLSSIKKKTSHPVTNMSWYDAVAFCQWAWAQTIAQKYRIQLPSEAEWEKAARGGLQIPHLQNGIIADLINNPEPKRIYPWGDEPPNKRRCNCRLDHQHKTIGTTPVGHYSQLGSDSPYGCADLAGNIWEWTVSLWGQDWEPPKYKYPYDPQDGRENLDSRERRVLRGGSFADGPRTVRCSHRRREEPEKDVMNLGFRVVALRI